MFEITFGMALDGARWASESASIGTIDGLRGNEKLMRTH